MTEVLAFLVGVSLVGGLGVAFLYVRLYEAYKDLAKKEFTAEHGLRLLAENERDGLKKQFEAQAVAIEHNALPWIPKTEKLEARYENEAIDKLENPSYYQDVVDGLGGLK